MAYDMHILNKTHGGKGSQPRPGNLQKYRDNFDLIFKRVQPTEIETNYSDDEEVKHDPTSVQGQVLPNY